jgi:hypothetical protein
MQRLLVRGRAWTCASALGVLLAPGLVHAAPPDEELVAPVERESGDIAPVEITPVEPEPSAEPPVEPAPEPAPEPEPPAPTVEPEPEPVEPEATQAKHDDHAVSLRNPKIPPTGNTQMWFRSTSFLDYFGNNYDPQTNNDRFYAFVNYVNFGSDSRLKKTWQVSTMMRVDTHNVFNTKSQPLCDADDDGIVSTIEAEQCNFHSDYRIERLQLRVGNKYFDVTAGDFNVNFGRGVALSIRKIADIGVDATIKGGRVDIRTKNIELTGIGGVANRSQSDFATRQLFRDPGYPHALCDKTPELTQNKYGNPWYTMCSDIITGGRLDAKLPGKIKFGSHYVFMWFGELLADQHEGLHLIGGDISRKQIAKHWDLFAGVTGLLRNPHHSPTFGGHYPGYVQNGLAAYLANSITFGNNFLLLEGKYYDNYVVSKSASAAIVQYAEAPTLERSDQIIPAASNTAGGRILFEHTFPESRLTLVANYLGYAFALTNDENMFDPNVGEMAHHGYAGVRWRDTAKGIELQAYAGYRWEGFQRPPEPGIDPYTRKLPAADIYINKVVGTTRGMSHSLSIKADWRYEEVQKGGAAPKHFHRGNVILGYALSPIMQLAFIGGYSSEFPPIPGEPQLHDQPCGTDASCNRKPHLWPGAELRINFIESSFIRLFAGRQVGGLLCVNGSCRNLPDFEGVRLDLVLSF